MIEPARSTMPKIESKKSIDFSLSYCGLTLFESCYYYKIAEKPI